MEKSKSKLINGISNQNTKFSKKSKISYFKDPNNKKTIHFTKKRTQKASVTQSEVTETKQEDYNKKVDKLKRIIEKKNKPQYKKKTLISKSKYKVIVSVIGIAIVNK